MNEHEFMGAGRLCDECGHTLNAPVHSVPTTNDYVADVARRIDNGRPAFTNVIHLG